MPWTKSTEAILGNSNNNSHSYNFMSQVLCDIFPQLFHSNREKGFQISMAMIMSCAITRLKQLLFRAKITYLTR